MKPQIRDSSYQWNGYDWFKFKVYSTVFSLIFYRSLCKFSMFSQTNTNCSAEKQHSVPVVASFLLESIQGKGYGVTNQSTHLVIKREWLLENPPRNRGFYQFPTVKTISLHTISIHMLCGKCDKTPEHLPSFTYHRTIEIDPTKFGKVTTTQIKQWHPRGLGVAGLESQDRRMPLITQHLLLQLFLYSG